MKAGIIAAGEGSRLSQGGIGVPKPLIPIGGKPMIARAIHTAAGLGATSIACIVNDMQPAVSDYLKKNSWPVPLELIVKTTPSSMESLFSLESLLHSDPFILLTVDAVCPFNALKRFLTEARQINTAKGVLALTRYVDDEKPLWARMDKRHRITALGEAACPSPYVTAGVYYFRPEIFRMVGTARIKKMNALRQFLGLLVEKDYCLYGVSVPKTIDVDYPEDIGKAEQYLREVDSGWAP